MSSQPRYLFHHVHKCGGNSLRIAFARWFLITYDYRQRSPTPENEQSPADFAKAGIDRSKLRNNALICGHFDTEGAYLWQRYSEVYNDGTRLITFLRHPLERAISHYFFGTKTGYLPITENSLTDFLLACRNPMAGLLSPNPKNAADILAPYWFVGTLENANKDLLRLAKMMAQPDDILPLTHVNHTGRPAYDLPNDVIATFNANNALDFALYNQARNFSTP